MRNLNIWLWAFLVSLTVLWALSFQWPATLDIITIRDVAVYWTGVLAIGTMSFAMVIAVRPAVLEDWLDGLDKSYRLHKWLGITALVLAVVHWALVNVLPWVFGEAFEWTFAWKVTPHPNPSELPAIQLFLEEQVEIAAPISHILFYGTALLIALALIKRFTYRRFKKTHWYLAVLYIVYVYHSIVFMDFDQWLRPVGIVTGLLMLGGTICGLWILTGRVGHGRKVAGTVEEITLFPELSAMDTTIQLDGGWKGHQAGQFAFVTFDAKEGAHPFTIRSAWIPEDKHINFVTKGLGDYTDKMLEDLKIGSNVTVEGPYGRFTFSDSRKHHIWVGAGVGITPFIARMKQLSLKPHDQVIDFFVVAPVGDPVVGERLMADAKASNVRLHFVIDGQADRLTGAGLRAQIDGWRDASIWFCGPTKFGESVKKDMIANGLNPGDFHQELFDMR